MLDFNGHYAAEKLMEMKMAEARADAAKDRMAREFQASSAHGLRSRRVIASAAFAILVMVIMVQSR